ncbi:hypothetical protein ACFQY5_41570 [Paeniroseomonas aquatica]|uniref:hypothetical protein n=1 Tax=Paeniroseomonas aquatica TaxID=373043 RepID=UPI00360F423B
MARGNLKRAKDELASGQDHRLRYAALEIRYAMEALTYERAMAYKADIPPSEYDTWQPREVLSLLTEIDPHAALTSTIAIGTEDACGIATDEMTVLGEDVVLTLDNLKQYGALGSYLHTPTLSQIDDPGAHSPVKLRKRIEACVNFSMRC